MPPTTLQLKQGLLLVHGTIYGAMVDALPVVQFSDLTNSIDRHNYIGFDWYADYFSKTVSSSDPYGSMTDNNPVDVEHWNVTGAVLPSGIEPWQECLVLLRRLRW
jgi:hypothetical protein